MRGHKQRKSHAFYGAPPCREWSTWRSGRRRSRHACAPDAASTRPPLPYQAERRPASRSWATLFVPFVIHGFSELPSGTVLLTRQPFGFTRASRHKHGSEGAGRPRHYDLVRHSLIASKRRFRGKQIRSDVRVLVGRARGRFCVSLVEDA
jgi:hypothetical protein